MLNSLQCRTIRAVILAACVTMGCIPAHGARVVRERETDEEAAGGVYAARRLFKRAQELLEAGERERGVKMLETIIDQYPAEKLRFEAYLALGRHYFETYDQEKAIDQLRNLEKLRTAERDPEGADRDIYLEGLYLMGVSYFRMRQYGSAFAVLRRITSDFPNTIWANQAYYYIGMSHFAQEHWSKAIKALSLVGTFVDPEGPTAEYVEAGHRLHVKLVDGDLPILSRLGAKISAECETKSGDKEQIPCDALTGKGDIFVGSIPTVTGVPVVGDGVLQVVGGDEAFVRYTDDSDKSGTKNVLREKVVKVVSSASVSFTLGTYESTASAAFLGQPLFVKLRDVDLDVSPENDSVELRIAAMYRPEEEVPEQTMAVDVSRLFLEEAEEFKVRDEVTLVLRERGDVPAHSGVFVGTLEVGAVPEGEPVRTTDDVLSCVVGDEVVATYLDELHVNGDIPLEIAAKLEVAGEIDSAPRAAQSVVADPVVRARKDLVEAEAYLELARIFKSMGLMEGAKEKSEEGLSRVEEIIRTRAPIPSALREESFRLKWDLHLAQDDFARAMATCRTFNRLYPESPLVDHALMGIGMVLLEKKDVTRAVGVFKQVLSLPHSHSKAEAQYRLAEIAETSEASADRRYSGKKVSIQYYKACAKNYPDSEFAGPSLAKVVDYHVETKDYAAADDLLEQIFMDYQDEDFLDSMLLKWVLVAYRMGDYVKAQEKCAQLMFEYPGSPHAGKAKQILPRIEAKLGRGSNAAG